MAEDLRANKKLKPLSERVIRDIDGKLPEQKRTAAWRQAMRLAGQICRQQRGDANKIYSVHAPETECPQGQAAQAV